MNEYILLDIGSSSIKAYSYIDKDLTTVLYKTVLFKEGFSETAGIREDKKHALIEILTQLKKSYPNATIQTYATAIFRKMSPNVQEKLMEEIKNESGVVFTIISQEEESAYLENALIGKITTLEPVMLINVGGGSTEIVIVQNQKTLQTYHIDMGVGTIMSLYPTLNELNPTFDYDGEVEKLIEKLPEIESNAEIAINSGGELTWMKLAHYALEKNTFFDDPDHPFYVTTENSRTRNKEIFTQIPLDELVKLMPDNPTWLHGTKAYNLLCEAICVKYGIKYLIPSDSNLINGVVRILIEM